MSQVCRQCSRVNPSEAAYCYWDGAILAGGSVNGGPINAGSVPFPGQFVFPGGQVCRNFDQLATTCQQNWQAAVELLKQGFFSGFLGGLGRADLAMAANEAAKFPDSDRGLDQLLAKIPTQVLAPPRLKVDPAEINLGQVPMGTDRTVQLHLGNTGMRLLYGSVVSDSKWLTLGEGQGASQKLFQFGHEATLQVHVKGQHLRAGNQPLEGELVIESNGGTASVKVKADVPITPFKEGVLAGSYTPRQIAEKARAKANEAKVFFENGAVAQWFTQNGWIYPVQGPPVPGLGSVQQFFEALGLAKPPKVELRTPTVMLQGDPGQVLTASIEVGTSEKKQVYAYATCDQPWVSPQRMKQAKATMASVPLTITVPPRSGESLTARVTVHANGTQKFVVPLALNVSGTYAGPPQTVPSDAVLALPYEEPLAAVQPASSGSPFAFESPPPLPGAVSATPPPMAPPPLPPGAGAVVDVSTPRIQREGYPPWMHLIPLGVLSLALLVLMLRDLIGKPSSGPGGAGSGAGGRPLVVFFDFLTHDEKKKAKTKKEEEELATKFRNHLTYGLVMIDPNNPQNPDSKRLTYDHRGRTNSTVVSINGTDKSMGAFNAGRWDKPPTITPYKEGTGTWHFSPDPIFLTQEVKVVEGEPVEITPGKYERLFDTCLVKYKLENRDNKPHRVGLRVMIDTFIGSNDGVPFTIPGQSGMVATSRDFRVRSDIPDFLQALEFPNLDNPGTTVQINLKLSDKLAPDRVSLTRWPGHTDKEKWEVAMVDIGDDSSIVLYWDPRDLGPKQSRDMAFSCGLGNLSLKGGKLGLTVGGSFVVGRELTAMALVADAKPGQRVKLELPKGLQLLSGDIEQAVPVAELGKDGRMRPSPVTWRIRALEAGDHTISVTTDNMQQSRRITIQKTGIF